jgi:hypothetical protein
MNFITSVKHADWTAPVMVIKKPDGSARLCIDYSTSLNNALQLYRHRFPLPEDIFATLNEGHVFSQIYFSDAYLQVELDGDSEALCTINTHWGCRNISACHAELNQRQGFPKESWKTCWHDC